MNPERFLHQRDPNLQKSEAVEKAVNKRDRLNRFKKEAIDTDLSESGLESLKKTPNTPEARIAAYISRLESIFLNENSERRKRNLELLRSYIYEEFVIKKEDIPESYWNLQRKIARERGESFPDEIPESLKDDAYEILSSDQKESLDYWMEYLSSSDALYESWFKFFAMKSVLGLADFDKHEHKFSKRNKSTTGPFPDLNQEALATTEDYFIKRLSGESIENPIPEPENPYADEQKPVSDEEFQAILSSENFARYYAFAIEHVVADSKEFWPITEGEWVKYQQENQGGHYDEGGYYNEDGDWVEYMDEELYNQDNDDAMVQKDLNSPSQATLLTKSLQGKGTGWCTAGVNTATAQLENGDFYVYYSKDKLGVPSVPRLAIRMEGGQIAEVRGVAQNQNIDPYIAPVLEEKMSEFGERGEIYKKKAEDMRRLTDIDSRHKSGEDLSQNDLYFLYQVYESIEGFGYGEDTRIAEITSQRDWKQDMSVMYESSSDLDLAFKLIDSGKDALVIHKLDMFQVGDHNEIAMKILDDVGVLAFTGPDSEGGTRDFKKFQGLSADVAQRFFKSGMGSLVVDNLKSFRGLTSEMALQIMPTADGRDPGRRLVVSNLQSFEKLNREVAERLIGRGRGFKDVVEHIEVFDVDHNDVALAFLNGGSRPLGYRNLFGKLSGLSTEVALKFIAKGDKRMVSWNLQNFGSLDREILSKLNLSEEAIQEYLNRQTVQ